MELAGSKKLQKRFHALTPGGCHTYAKGDDHCPEEAPVIETLHRQGERLKRELEKAIRRGIIMPSLVVSYSHRNADSDQTVDAVDGALGVYRVALDEGSRKSWSVPLPMLSAVVTTDLAT